jgi:hypothetical protein
MRRNEAFDPRGGGVCENSEEEDVFNAGALTSAVCAYVCWFYTHVQ